MAYMETTNIRIDNIIKDIGEFKHSLEFTQEQLARSLDNDEKCPEVQDALVDLSDKLDDLENRSRRNNLCFDGIPETAEKPYETWDQSEGKIKELITNKFHMKAEDVIIERAHRVGPKKDDKPRSIVAKFLCFKDRESIFKNGKNLKGSGIYVREDYSTRIAEKRRQLLPEMYEARKKGLIAFLRYDKLIVHRRKSQDQLQHSSEDLAESTKDLAESTVQTQVPENT